MKKLVLALFVVALNVSLFAQVQNPFQADNDLVALDARTDAVANPGEASDNESRGPINGFAKCTFVGDLGGGGTLYNAWNVTKVTWNSIQRGYEVTVPIYYIPYLATIVVTPISKSTPRFATTSVQSGHVLVKLWDLNGYADEGTFDFFAAY